MNNLQNADFLSPLFKDLLLCIVCRINSKQALEHLRQLAIQRLRPRLWPSCLLRVPCSLRLAVFTSPASAGMASTWLLQTHPRSCSAAPARCPLPSSSSRLSHLVWTESLPTFHFNVYWFPCLRSILRLSFFGRGYCLVISESPHPA